jgi:mono/diheme cytochrome c family protein
MRIGKEMRTAKTFAIASTALVLTILAVCYGFLRAEGLSARRKPGNLEYAVANYALGLSIPAEAKKLKNPIKATPEILSETKKDYSDNCAVCHASDGTGITNTARGLSPKVPDLNAVRIQRLTDGEMFYIIKNGVRFTGMPGWDFPDERIWRLALLIRLLGNERALPRPDSGQNQ